MAMIDTTHGHHEYHREQSFWSTYVFSLDHKVIGMQYLFTGMLMGLMGGFFAYAFRMQLAFPGTDVPFVGLITSAKYNALVTSHGSIMIFWMAMPVLVAALVFPRLNRLSYQIFLLSAIVLIGSFFVPGGAFGGAWTAYPPLSANAGYSLTPWGSTLWLLAVALEFVAFLLGGINFITTVMNSRAPGMKAFDIPIVIWMIVLASIMFMASVAPLIAGAVMLLFDQHGLL
jgi:cytochrome c oxidase subunit 1